MDYKYTDSAKEELENFKQEHVNQLENFIRRRKYVYGDDLIEVTGSDVKEAKRHFTVIDSRRSSFRQLMLGGYLFLGIVLTIGGLFYEQIRAAMTGDPKQLLIITMGISMVFASLLGHWWFGFRDRVRSARPEFNDDQPKQG